MAQALAKAKADQEAAAERARQDELDRQARATNAAADAKAAREADLARRASILGQITEAIEALLTDDSVPDEMLAETIAKAIMNGDVPRVTVEF